MTDYILCESNNKLKGFLYFKTPQMLKTITNKEHIKSMLNTFANIIFYNTEKISLHV